MLSTVAEDERPHRGGKAVVSLEEGLKRTIEWMNDRRALYKSGIYNV